MKKELYKKLLSEVEEEHQTQHLRTRNSKVLIIDGLNTFIRSWTTNPAMNEDGDHVGGVMGSLNSIGYQIRMFNPTRVVVVFDGRGGSKKRKKIFEGYKADRTNNRFRVNRQYPEMMNQEEEQESMKRQFVWLADFLNYLPVTTMIFDEMEADDVIGYISNDLLKENEEGIIVSTDKDFLQLVNERISVFSPTKKKHYTKDEVFNEWGLYPQNLLVFRSLDGDKSDNIPGVKGCGLKTFLKRFPEFEEDTILDFDELFKLCEERQGSYKIYDEILENEDIILRNKDLMSLVDVQVNSSGKLRIMDRYNEPNKKFDKMDFLRVGSKYKMLQNWRNINDWLMSTFNNIVTE